MAIVDIQQAERDESSAMELVADQGVSLPVVRVNATRRRTSCCEAMCR
jgi:hypothetical protein